TVVGCFLRDGHIMRVAFPNSGGGNSDKLGTVTQLAERLRAAIAHGRPQSADHLVHYLRKRPTVRHAALDTFGNELLDVVLRILKIPVLAARLHGSQRSHSAVRLVLPSLVENRLARALLHTSKQSTYHDALRAGSKRLRDVAGLLDATIRDDRDVM